MGDYRTERSETDWLQNPCFDELVRPDRAAVAALVTGVFLWTWCVGLAVRRARYLATLRKQDYRNN